MSDRAAKATSEIGEEDGLAMVIVDADGDVRGVDEVADRWLGRRADDVVALNIAELFPGLVKENESVERVAGERFWRRGLAIVGDGRELAIEARIRRLFGGGDSQFIVEFEPVLEHGVAPDHRSNPAVDMQKTLDLTWARFQRALEMTHTLVADQDTNLRYVRSYKGRFFSDTIGKRDEDLFPADQAQRIREIKQKALDTGEPVRQDITVSIHGEVSHFDLLVDPIRDGAGQVTGIACFGMDITERVNAQAMREQQSARVQAELEAKNQALEMARHEADQANAAKSRFLAMMSHEIRTPLNGVLGMAGVLLESLEDSSQREIVETIRMSGDALLTIINDILDFTKIEAGLMELEEQPFALRHCLDDVIDLMGPQARTKFVELVFAVDPDVPAAIWGDITRLRQVLVNLVSNAMKFTDAGEIVVAAKLDASNDPEELLLHFTVRDTGIGIAADRLGRLFQAFSQVDASINRRYGGTGLGLAICKRLVELMQGQIWVESTLGAGTTFHFTISTIAAPEVGSELFEATAPARRELEGLPVLIVDDNATSRRVFADQMQSFGMVPTAVSCASEALEVLAERTSVSESSVRRGFALALIDLEMPERSGFQLVTAIRDELRLIELPMLLLTASDGSTSSIAKGWNAPCLTKPVKVSTLFDAVVRRIIQASHVSSRSRRSVPIDATLGMRHPLRILLAEDNVINQKVALLLLQRAGYRADIAANGQEVLAAVTAKAYDLILMDVQMPEMDGLEATRRLRGPGPWLGNPRIVAMTADVLREGREACIAVGMDDFVAKPIRIRELLRTLEYTAKQRANDSIGEDGWLAGTEVSLQVAEDVIIDEEAFNALRQLCALEGDDALATLVRDFLEDSRRMLEDLVNRITHQEWAIAERLAHTLKGTSGTFGAVGLSQHMAALEAAIRERSKDDLPRLLETAKTEYSRASETLHRLSQAASSRS